jgi:hypothetical protein
VVWTSSRAHRSSASLDHHSVNISVTLLTNTPFAVQHEAVRLELGLLAPMMDACQATLRLLTAVIICVGAVARTFHDGQFVAAARKSQYHSARSTLALLVPSPRACTTMCSPRIEMEV